MADQLTDDKISEFKEAFSLFDKDDDAWWVIPLVWLPVASWLVSMSLRMSLPLPQVALAVPFATMILGVHAALLEEVSTSTVSMRDETKGRLVQKAKIEIVLGKSEKFDSIMSAAAAAAAQEPAAEGKK